MKEQIEIFDTIFQSFCEYVQTEPNLKEQILDTFLEHDILKYVGQHFYSDDVLGIYSHDDIKDYLEDEGYSVFEDLNEAEAELRSSGYFENDFTDGEKSPGSFRKKDCVELINQIVDKEGWQYLHNLLEKQI